VESLSCDSAGVIGYHKGEGAYPKMKSVAFKRGYRLDSISRQIHPDTDFKLFDMVVGMDDQNIRDLNKMAGSNANRSKIYKMTDFCSRQDYSFVPDPYYGDTKDYELVIDLLEDGCEGLINSIIGTKN
jgi:protein-tyrosine phosphatase